MKSVIYPHNQKFVFKSVICLGFVCGVASLKAPSKRSTPESCPQLCYVCFRLDFTHASVGSTLFL